MKPGPGLFGNVFGIVALFLLAAFGGAIAPARSQTAVAAVTPDRQILVMLRQRPPHFRPNTAYGGNYGDTQSQSVRERIGRSIAKAHGLKMVTNWPMPLIGLDCIVMSVPEGRTNYQAAAEVTRDPAVEWAEPMHVYQTQGAPAGGGGGDPLYPAEPAARLWHLAELHHIATGQGVTVAVIDTRIDAGHPDLAGQVELSEDFEKNHPSGPEQHGTGVAGIIAARADNGVGIAGIAPRARLMGLRACWQLPGAEGSVCDSLGLAKALSFAIEHHAEIVNLSLSGPPDQLLGRLIDVGLARGETFVASYDPVLPKGGFPASHAGVIAVTDRVLANDPPGVYMAPGRDVPTTEPGGKWDLVNGSSYAAAHVSGLAALARQHMAGRGRFELISASPDGAINAMATLMRPPSSCDVACSRQLAASSHP